MLILPLKPGVRYDLGAALGRWLDSDAQVSFAPTNPLQFVLPKPDFSSEQCRADLLRLSSLRHALTDVFLKPASHKHALEDGAMDDCHEYHAVLLEFEKRGFPTLEDPDSDLALAWKGAWPPHAMEKHATLIFDRAVVVYNTVALLTAKIADCSVTDRDECKAAVAYCQQGASLLAILAELLPSQDFSTVDLSPSMLAFWEKYLMAYAQQCIYRMMALADTANTKHATLAVLSSSAYQLFNEALTAAQDPRLQSEVEAASNDWAAYCKASSMLSMAKAEYHQSVVHRLAHEHGKEIARLRESLAKLKSLRDFLKTLDADGSTSYTRRECLAILPVVEDRLHEADGDNYRITHEEIPRDMPAIPPKQLAKSSPTLPPTMLQPKRPMFVGL